MNKMYTTKQIKNYATSWLKPVLCTDTKDTILENERLQAFIHYIDADDSDNIDNFLRNQSKQHIKNCIGEDLICTICSIGDDLENEERCKYEQECIDNYCPSFECVEQCRLCPNTCTFLG